MKKLLEKGKKFGRLTVQQWEKGGWICQCDCGNFTEVYEYNLKSNKVL